MRPFPPARPTHREALRPADPRARSGRDDAPPSVFAWSGGGLRPVAAAPVGELLVADSWLVEDGLVRGYERHWARFAGACADLDTAPGEVDRFRAAVTAALPRRGRWFPRVDLLGGRGAGSTRLVLRLRPARPPMGAARVLLAEPGDPRSHPRRKGPDLELLLDLRAQAVAAGCDELVLRDAAGRLLAGALTALLWWEDDALCSTPDARTLPSVTRELVFELARERGVEIRRRSPLPCELDGCETWLVNAAEGICVLRAWERDGPAAGALRRAPGWQAALVARALPLDL